jgi:hypothetical protein
MTRKSKREIEQTLDEIEESPPSDYPVVDTLVEFLGFEWTCVDASENLYRREEEETVYHIPEDFQQAITDVLSDD